MLILQCFYFMKNAGVLKLIPVQKKSPTFSVLMVLPNSHYCVDMHRDRCRKQRFASQSFWQYCFPFTASEVKLSLLSRPFTISLLPASFPLGVKCLTPAPRRLPMSASSLLPALCFSKPSFRFHHPSCWEEILVNACRATSLSPSNPSLTPLGCDACRDGADS